MDMNNIRSVRSSLRRLGWIAVLLATGIIASMPVATQQKGLLAGAAQAAAPERGQPLVTPDVPFPTAKPAPEALAAAKQRAVAALLQKASGGRLVPVIVGFDAAFVPEGRLTPESVAVQRQGLMDAGDAILAQLLRRSVSDVKRFATIPYLAAQVDADALQMLGSLPQVTSIVEDVPEPPLLGESTAIVQANRVWDAGLTGTGWNVAVLDTGVDRTHEMFAGGKVVSEACYSTTGGGGTSVCPGAVNSTAAGSGVNCSPSLAAECAHGTHVAGIAAGNSAELKGVAPGAGIVAIQVFSAFDTKSCGGAPCVLAWTSDQILGLERVLTLSRSFRISSVTLGVGGGRFTTEEACDAANGARKAVVDHLRSVDIATVVGTGNDGYADGISAPACISTAVAVGSTTKTGTVSSFSNLAQGMVELLAPGSEIRSSVPGNAYASWSGTSMAAPHVAGAWALLKAVAALKGDAGSVTTIQSALEDAGHPIFHAGSGASYREIRVADAAIQVYHGGRVPGLAAQSEPTGWLSGSSTARALGDANPDDARAASVTGITDIRTFLDRCPTNDPAASTILGAFAILRDGQPVASPIPCVEPYPALPVAQLTQELITFQVLRTAYYMSSGTQGLLPWTTKSLWDWMTSRVSGVNLKSAPNQLYCCDVINGKRYVAQSVQDDVQRNYKRDWMGISGTLSFFAHEIRHADPGAPGHTTGCPAFPSPTGAAGCDPTYDLSNLGSYGVAYWLESSWATGVVNVGIACSPTSTARTYVEWNRTSANSLRARFVSGAPPEITASEPYGGPCPMALQPPNGLTGSATGSTVNLSWVAPPAGAAPTAYIIEAGSAPGMADLARVSTGTAATTFTAGGVGNGTYYIRVRAVSSAGTSGPSNEALVIVGAAAPGAPTGLTASVSGSNITLVWTAPTTGGTPTTYVLEAGSGPALANLANFSTGNTVTAFAAGGVASGTYYVRVRATNSAGSSGPSNEAIMVVGGGGCTSPPSAPSGLTITQNSGGTVAFRWAEASGGPTTYILEAGSAPGLANLATVDIGGTGTTFATSGVGAGIFYLRVTAANACGKSGASNEVVLVTR